MRRLPAAVVMALVALRAAPAGDPPPSTPSSPLTETLEKRLVQLDVGVEGDPDAIRRVTAKDFDLSVGGREIQGLVVDHLCGEAAPTSPPEPQEEPPGQTQSPPPTPSVVRPRATFIFFFDQRHLTMAGRALSLETAHDLIARLIGKGNRASIVSNGKRLETIVPMTEDTEKLFAGLETLRNDRNQLDSYAETEETREREVLEAYGARYSASPSDCLPLVAKVYERQDWQEAKRATERLAYTVGALDAVPAPKSLIYFGDTLRQKAGLHYLHAPPCEDDTQVVTAELTPSAAAEFDAVIDEALARGVHFFTIQAAGLVTSDFTVAKRPGSGARRRLGEERIHQAQDALVTLAAETGGEAFLGGASRDFIATRIATRTSCSLLLSFPPGDLPRDKPLPVTLALHVPKVKLRTQGRVVIPSPTSMERARLMAAFTDPGSSDDGSLGVLLIPRGGDGTKWQAALQLRLGPSGIANTSVELGASIIRGDRVSDQFASSIAAKSGTRPIVLEKNLDIAPGAFAVVAVAREVSRGDVASRRLETSWPNPSKGAAAIAPIAVLQMGPAAMSKDGAVTSTGSLARDVDERLDPSIGISLASVVCRGSSAKGPVVVERWIEGGAKDEFAPTTIEATGGPCVQTMDALRPGRLARGDAEYRVTARIGDEIVAQERRTLHVSAIEQ